LAAGRSEGRESGGMSRAGLIGSSPVSRTISTFWDVAGGPWLFAGGDGAAAGARTGGTDVGFWTGSAETNCVGEAPDALFAAATGDDLSEAVGGWRTEAI